jgi:Xaa-Pro aminopeptidase
MNREPALKNRFRNIVNRIEKVGIDALVLTKSPNVVYLSGGEFVGSSIAVIGRNGIFDLIVSILDVEGYESPGNWVRIRTVNKGEKYSDKLAESLLEVGATYVELDDIGCQMHELLRKRTNALLRSGNRFVEEARAVKDELELELIREAGRLTKLSFESVESVLKPGVKEVEIAAEAEFAARKRGADGMAFQTLVASGWRSAIPHATASRKVVETGDVVVVDMGVKYQGYCFDMTRTFKVGKIDARLERLFQSVLEAHSLAVGLIKADVAAKELERTVVEYFEREKVKEFYTHSLGHGVGLEVHEDPNLSLDSNYNLAVGNVITIEPGLYVKGLGGVRHENVISVGEDKAIFL